MNMVDAFVGFFNVLAYLFLQTLLFVFNVTCFRDASWNVS